MKSWLMAIVVLVVAAVDASAHVKIPVGETRVLEFERPGMAHPEGRWSEGTGTPTAQEDDVFRNDEMGEGTPTDDGGATVEVENKGGNLSGPNGDVQNGFGEGDTIEVRMCFRYCYPVTITHRTEEHVGHGVVVVETHEESYQIWRCRNVYTETQEVTAC